MSTWDRYNQPGAEPLDLPDPGSPTRAELLDRIADGLDIPPDLIDIVANDAQAAWRQAVTGRARAAGWGPAGPAAVGPDWGNPTHAPAPALDLDRGPHLPSVRVPRGGYRWPMPDDPPMDRHWRRPDWNALVAPRLTATLSALRPLARHAARPLGRLSTSLGSLTERLANA